MYAAPHVLLYANPHANAVAVICFRISPGITASALRTASHFTGCSPVNNRARSDAAAVVVAAAVLNFHTDALIAHTCVCSAASVVAERARYVQ